MTAKRILVAQACIMLLLLLSCRRETDEDRVRKVVSAVQEAAGGKKTGAVLEHVAKDYRDPQGNDYNGIKGLLAFYFFRHQAVAVHIPSLDVQVNGDAAQARFQAVLTARGIDGGSTGAVLPDALGVYDFEVRLRKDADAWKVTSATWVRVGAGTQPQP